MQKKQLSIRLNGESVGILEQMQTGVLSFTYDSDVKNVISVNMPIQHEPYIGEKCEAYFGGLLPESETVRKIIGKRYGVSANNNFSLLGAIGYDCAGAISCHQLDEPIIFHGAMPLAGKILSDSELYRLIAALPTNPLFMDADGLKLSLAGVQDKAAVCLIENKIALPSDGCPTTHILKPASTYFDGLTENEYFCMKLAKSIGLPVPEVTMHKIKDISFLLIERYDRRIHDNQIIRIHQEDFCQALGIPSIRKYQNEGGPGFKDCFELLNTTSQPAIDRNLIANALVFNFLIGNMDAHGKNFSLLHQGSSTIRLAPFYDLVCTRAYKDLSPKMAMKIGSKYDSNDVLPRHWQQLCETIKYRYLAMESLIEKLGNQIKLAAIQEKEQLKMRGVNDPMIDGIISVINNNIDRTLNYMSKQHGK